MEASGSTAGSASSSASKSGSADVAGLVTLNAGETCMYMSPSPYTGCRMPRSCQSCLATAGCMIDEVGACVSTEDEPLEASKDFTLATTEGLVLPNATADGVGLSAQQSWQFPAGRVKYCSMDDATCATCARTNFWRSRNSSPDSRYCRGDDGSCVCIDVCERPWRVQQDCSARRGYTGMYAPAPSPTPSVTSGRSASSSTTNMMGDPGVVNRIWQAMVGSIVFVLVVLGFVVWTRRKAELRARHEQEERRRRAQERRERRRQTTADQLGVSALSLSGWDAYRRDLIDKELAQLSTGGETKTVTPAAVQEVDSDDEDDDGDAREGRTAAYVRMQEPEGGQGDTDSGAVSSAALASTPDETTDGSSSQRPSGPSERPLAPLSVSHNLQPRR